MPYDKIVIIYNPKSTGAAATEAENLQRDLLQTKAGRQCGVDLTPSEYPQHGRVLAREIAQNYTSPLIISVSGDGGYHDVVNGVADAAREKDSSPQAVTAIVPAGNANDHYRVVGGRPLPEIIDESEPSLIDIIEVEIGSGPEIRRDIAHSYVGFGVTSRAARRLNAVKLSLREEVRIVSQTLHYYPGVKIRVDGDVAKYDSLIAANINEMAKVLTLAPDARLTDGKFEVVSLRHVSRWKFYWRILQTVIGHHPDPTSVDELEVVPQEPTSLQIDGEVIALAADEVVRLRSRQKFLRVLR